MGFVPCWWLIAANKLFGANGANATCNDLMPFTLQQINDPLVLGPQLLGSRQWMLVRN